MTLKLVFFCEKCGTSVYWTINADALKGMIAIGAGTFDPPAFWFDISGEIFTRSKAPFITIEIITNFQSSITYLLNFLQLEWSNEINNFNKTAKNCEKNSKTYSWIKKYNY